MYKYIHQAVTKVRRGVILIYQLILKTNTEVLVYLDLVALLWQVRNICWQPRGVIFLQVVSQYSNLLAPITVDAVLRVIDPSTADNVNLKDIRVVQKLGYVRLFS